MNAKRQNCSAAAADIVARPIAINWNSGMPVFACEPFLKQMGMEYGWLGGTDSSGSIRCILPFTIVRKSIFRLVRFRVETMQVGAGVNIEEERQFLNSAIEYFRSIRADMIIPSTTNAVFRTYPDGADAAPYGTYVVDLAPPEESIWMNLQPRNRSKIRSAMKAGVEIREVRGNIGEMYRLLKETLGRSKMVFMRSDEFTSYVKVFGENIKIFAAYFDGGIQGCTVVPFSDYCAYFVYGGSIERPVSGAISLLHWEAMRRFRGLGVQKYDFVGVRIDPEKGSKQEGLMLFKERFGGHLVRGYLWKFGLRRLPFAAYSLAVKLQRGGDIVDAERHKLSVS
jgi:hypothetical protein